MAFPDFPSGLFCGEVRHVTVQLRNSGPLPLHTLSIASTTPGFFTVGNPHSTPTPAQETSVTYPLLTTAAETDTDQHTIDRTDVPFVTRIPLPEDRLDPGHTLDIPLWVRGPATHGHYTVHFLFLYVADVDNPRLR